MHLDTFLSSDKILLTEVYVGKHASCCLLDANYGSRICDNYVLSISHCALKFETSWKLEGRVRVRTEDKTRFELEVRRARRKQRCVGSVAGRRVVKEREGNDSTNLDIFKCSLSFRMKLRHFMPLCENAHC